MSNTGKIIAFTSLAGLLLAFADFASRHPSKTPSARIRPPRGAPKYDPVAAQAARELHRWRGIDENHPKGRKMIADYWRQGVGVSPKMDQHWSGAFIAYVANKGAPGSLPKTGGHAAYAAMQIRNADPDKYTTFLGDLPVRVGDIILKPRPGETRDFDELRSGKFFGSHGDIVTKVTPTHAIAIGGNKRGDTVATEAYPLNPDGSARGVFAVLRRARDFPIVVANLGPDWRRAREEEVDPEWVQDAWQLLPRYAPGEAVFGPGYAIAFETHQDPKRGPHKGASIFVRNYEEGPPIG